MREEKIVKLFNKNKLDKVEELIGDSLSGYTKRMVEINPLTFKDYDAIRIFLKAIHKEDHSKIDSWVKSELLESDVRKNQLNMF